VGREILQGLLADEEVAAVHALARRPLGVQHPKLTVHTVDFAALPPLPPVDEAYLALGTTIKVAGSEAAFRAVDFEANLAVACAAQVAGARRIGVVSAMGADAASRIFYNRVKGELEQAVADLGYEGVVIARPSLLAGDRAALGQPERAGERIGLRIGRWLKPLIPANYRPIRASDVARALLRAVPHAQGRRLLLSGAMQVPPVGPGHRPVPHLD
jgi:uncharacterized protein YbjT (DUF2867 family)